MSSYSLADLCSLADVTPRTVRYYIVQGLLRPPAGAGPAARYDDGHLYRLRMVRQLQKEHLPLAEIRRRLAVLTDAEVEDLTVAPPRVGDSAADYVARVLASRGVPGRPANLPAASYPRPLATPGLAVREPAPSLAPAAYSMEAAHALEAEPPLEPPPRSQWDRVALTRDIELHIRRPLSREQNRRVDRLIQTARSILEEDES